MEWELERLSTAMQDEIRNAEARLTQGIQPHSESSFATFEIDGRQHAAYYIVQEEADGTKRFVFHVLIH